MAKRKKQGKQTRQSAAEKPSLSRRAWERLDKRLKIVTDERNVAFEEEAALTEQIAKLRADVVIREELLREGVWTADTYGDKQIVLHSSVGQFPKLVADPMFKDSWNTICRIKLSAPGVKEGSAQLYEDDNEMTISGKARDVVSIARAYRLRVDSSGFGKRVAELEDALSAAKQFLALFAEPKQETEGR